MSSLFEVETQLIKMFIDKQNEIKNLIKDNNHEIKSKQFAELENFQKQLNIYKIMIESNNSANTNTRQDLLNSKTMNNEQEWWNLSK
jgi:hypothetical protein